ncbi:MAG: hypothetical protein LBF12_01615 [Christensenellaceae bacterium]|jgi:glycosyltransferase involved in cell wall biosynthesis|nr:hypothetical protein [Christensenellaceae bacterium]
MSKPYIIFYPDYSSGNPYQKLLYSVYINIGWSVKAGYIDEAISIIKQNSKVIFHMHWLNAIFKNCKTGEDAWDMVNNFIHLMRSFQQLGGFVIWTVHNHLPHENRFSEQDLRLRHFLCSTADRIHLHCTSHIKELNYLPLKIDKIKIHRHGSYLGYYGKFDINKRIEKLKTSKIKVLFMGMLRQYKDIDNILNLAKQFREFDIEVMIAGNPDNDELKIDIADKCNKIGVKAILRRLTETEIHQLCSEYNVGILSYSKILTSGTLKLYLSYGMIVVASNIPAITAEDRYNTFLYTSTDDICAKICKMSKDELIEKAKMSYLLATESCWSADLFDGIGNDSI